MDLTGKTFGYLTVLGRAGTKNKCALWDCECKCGNRKKYRTHHLTQKKNGCKSCGCLKKSLLQGEEIKCKICRRLLPISSFYLKDGVKTRHNACKECLRPIFSKKRKERNIRVRLEALKAYSGNAPACQCCGETHVEFLTIDHIDGGGGKHRKEIGNSSGRMFRWLRDNGYPDGYRVLCMNCNWSRGLHGYCPHERKKKNHS
jgi:hypothetical protein